MFIVGNENLSTAIVFFENSIVLATIHLLLSMRDSLKAPIYFNRTTTYVQLLLAVSGLYFWSTLPLFYVCPPFLLRALWVENLWEFSPRYWHWFHSFDIGNLWEFLIYCVMFFHSIADILFGRQHYSCLSHVYYQLQRPSLIKHSLLHVCISHEL